MHCRKSCSNTIFLSITPSELKLMQYNSTDVIMLYEIAQAILLYTLPITIMSSVESNLEQFHPFYIRIVGLKIIIAF